MVGRRGVALTVTVAMVATAIGVVIGGQALPAAAEQPARALSLFGYAPDASSLLLPTQMGELSFADSGRSLGMAAARWGELTAELEEEEEEPRYHQHAVSDAAIDGGSRTLHLLDLPGRSSEYAGGQGQLSGDGMTYVADFASGQDSLGSCSEGEPTEARYWNGQIAMWQRSTPFGEFGDPELVSGALGATGCDGEDLEDGGPPLMGVGGDSFSVSPTVSSDGSVVAFASAATDLVASPPTGPNAWESSIYVWEEGTGVSLVTPPGMNGLARDPAISGDGDRIAFISRATNLVSTPVPADTEQIYLATRSTTTPGTWDIELVSQDASGNPGEEYAFYTEPSIDAAGEKVVFTSSAKNLDDTVDLPENGDVAFVRDLVAGTTQALVNGAEPDGDGDLQAHALGWGTRAQISWDGARIAVFAGSSLPEGARLLVFDGDDAASSATADRRTARVGRGRYRGGNTQSLAIGGLGPHLIAFASGGAPKKRFEGSPDAIYFVGPGGPGFDPARAWHGDPVDTATGSFRQDETDLAAPPGAGPASISRSYTSTGEASSGVFGPGWSSTLDTRLDIDPDGDLITLETANGQRLAYELVGSAWVPQDGQRDVLADTGPGWSVTAPTGAVEAYDELGRLVGISNPGQPVVTITWGDLTPTALTSASGYEVALSDWRYGYEWDPVTEEYALVQIPEPDGTIDQATANDGRQVDFAYDDPTGNSRRLASVSRPHAVGQPAGTYGVRTYEMSGTLLARIVDQVDATRTRVVVENSYDGLGRVTHQVTDTGDELEFAYAKKPNGLGGLEDAVGFTTVTNQASGDVTVYEYNELGEVVGVTDASGLEVTRSWATDRPEQSTSRSGVTTDHAYDDAGRLLEVTETVGSTTRTIQELTYVVPDTSPAALADDRVATVTDEAGVTITFTYDGASHSPQTMSVPCDPDSTDPTTPCPSSGLATTTYTYEIVNGAPVVASTTDPDGVVTEFGYDDAGRAETVTTYDGATALVTTYDTIRPGDVDWTETNPAAVEVQTTETPGGSVLTEVFDAEGRLIESRDPLYDGTTHLATTHTYSLDGALASTSDPSGDVTTYSVARPGDPWWAEAPEIAEVQTLTGPDGVASITKIDRSGDVVVEQRGNPGFPAELATTTHTYGALGRRLSTTDPTGVTTTFEYDVEGRLEATVDEDGERVETAYDDVGRPTVVTDQLGQTTTTTYDALGRVAAVEDREGHDTTFTYDDAGRPHTTTDARGGVTETLYTPAGRLAAEIDATGRATSYRYDTAGRQVEVEQPSGATTTTAYDLDGLVASVTSPEGRVTSYTYDDLGRTLTVADPMTGTTTMTYTPAGLIATRTDATGGEVEYGYVGGRLETVTDPLERVTTYGYDSRGNRTSRTDARSGVREWTFDLADRLTGEIDPLGRDTTYTYDDLGRLETTTDGASRTETLVYDDAGRVTSSQFGNVPVTYTYDDEGRRETMASSVGTTTWTYDEVGNVTALDEVGSRDLAWTYDLAGRRVEVTLPNGGRQRQVYDADGRMDGVERWDGSAWVPSVDLALDDDGLAITRDVAGGMDATWDRDPVTGRVDTYAEDLGGTVTSTDLTYDAAGRVLTEATGAGTTTYDYDDAGQLLSADRPGTAEDETFAYDELGRRTTSTEGATTTTYAWDAASQLTSRTVGATAHTYTYDGSGRRTRESWNSGTSYRQWAYSSRGELNTIRHVTPAGTDETTRYLRGDGRILSSTTTPAGGTSRTTLYAWDDTSGLAQPVWMRIGSSNHVTATYDTAGLARLQCSSTTVDCEGPVAHDALGSAVETADTDDVVASDTYSAYGDPGTAVLEPEHGFRSELHIADLIHLRARDYDPQSGTFLRPDPLDGVDGTTTVSNPYHYGDNDPVNNADPTGLRVVDRGPEMDCFDRGGNLFLSEPMSDGSITINGCLNYDPCADDGLWGLRHLRDFGCDRLETLTGILAFIGSFAAGSFCAILAGPAGWAAAGAAGGACGGMAYRYMENARNGQALMDGVFDPKAIAVDVAIGVAFAGVTRGIGTRWGRARSGGSSSGGVADDAARAGAAPRCSFSAETRVLMADGSTKPISEVEVGDEVWATDPETGESGPRRVDAELPHTDQLLTLRTSAGDIVTTEDHEYWNETDEEWQGAQDLDEGDRLRTADGTVVTVEALDWSTLHTATAYDLDVAGIDTFYVATTADTEVLVHNCDLPRLGHRNVLDGKLPPGNRPHPSWTREDLVQLRGDLVTSLANRKGEIGTTYAFDPSDYIHPKRIQDETDLLVAVEKALSGS